MRLGQNFLISAGKIKKIIEALDLKSNDTIIEIGAGHGEITEIFNFSRFARSGVARQFPIFKVIAIEKDKKLVDFLRNSIETKWKLNGNSIEIIHGNALKVLPDLISQFPNFSVSDYKLVGNIPFYITGRLLRIISELKIKPKLAVFVIQKEVAQRIISRPPRMNILAASVQFWAEPKIISYISKKEFKPEPEVDAAIIRLSDSRLTSRLSDSRRLKYYKLINVIFKQPRKTILNNLKNNEEIIKNLQKFGVNPQDRPQNLSIEQLQQLSTLF